MLAQPTILGFVGTYFLSANGYGTQMGARNHTRSLTEPQHHIIDSTNPRCAFDDRVEDRLHIRRRATDNAEYLRGRRLMFQSLAQLRVTFLDLFKEAHIFN